MYTLTGTRYNDNGRRTTETHTQKVWEKLEDSYDIEEINVGNYNIVQDESNCGILRICNFPSTAPKIASIRNLEANISEAINNDRDDIFTGHFLMGTINSQQEAEIGNAFRKAGWNITELFHNNNSGNDCFLITKDIY